MKEFFSKTLNIVTICCLFVWITMIVISAFRSPELLEKTFTMSEKLIDMVIGSLIGAGGVKVKQIIDAKKEAEAYDTEPTNGNFE